jgi:diaminohydroxyphosphoribosylaminopyrimidine deaminase/5-amino-6-(5-phosphoribosylamino)uracil reductase
LRNNIFNSEIEGITVILDIQVNLSDCFSRSVIIFGNGEIEPSMVQIYEKYMQRCIDLARNGKGRVAPNPLVGSVIVYNDKIIGEGYHQVFGGAHAEVNAIRSVADKSILPQSTLFVNLEPCAHSGKTPPCSDLIVSEKIKKVVIGTVDPNPMVAGRGIQRLHSAGIDVVENILKEECCELNKRFFTFHQHHRPFIILKWAQSNDGYIDIVRSPGTPIGPNWISNPVSRKLVHKWRSVEQAIMVGTNTVIYDNPSLDTRFWSGKSPLRVVPDRTGRIPATAKIFDGSHKTIVFTENPKEKMPNVEFVKTDFSQNVIGQMLDYFFINDIQSVMVEGGSRLIQSFIESGVWDEARVFVGHADFKSGIKAPHLSVDPASGKFILNDKLLIFQNLH